MDKHVYFHAHNVPLPVCGRLRLFMDSSNAPQGVLRCWLDIMPPGEAKAFLADDVALPPPTEFEVINCLTRGFEVLLRGKRI